MLHDTWAVTTVIGLEPSGRALADADKVLISTVLSPPSSPAVVSSSAVSVAVGPLDSYLSRLLIIFKGVVGLSQDIANIT